MGKIAVVTDSNSGISQAEASKLGIHVIPMPFNIDGEDFFEGINLDYGQFFDKLEGMAEISTSQPSPGVVCDLWDEILEEYGQLIYIPMSSGLSGSCQTAVTLAQDYDNRVFVVDNKRISVTQKQSVYDALYLIEQGKEAAEIKDILEKEALNASIYICVPNLEYLKRGGRLTPAVAAIGTLLKIRPVLQIQGDKLDAYTLARTAGSSRSAMISAVAGDLEKRFKGDLKNCALAIAYTDTGEDADVFKQEILDKFPEGTIKFCEPLSLSIACHIGSGALGIAIIKKIG